MGQPTGRIDVWLCGQATQPQIQSNQPVHTFEAGLEIEEPLKLCGLGACAATEEESASGYAASRMTWKFILLIIFAEGPVRVFQLLVTDNKTITSSMLYAVPALNAAWNLRVFG